MKDKVASPKFHIASLSFILGSSAIIAQVVFLRELITVFYGNEIAYAIILANWLLGVAIGSFTISRWQRLLARPQRAVFSLQFLLVVFLPLGIYFARILKNTFGIPPGEIMGLIPMYLLSLCVLIPLTVLMGGLFSAICHLSVSIRKEAAGESIAHVYLWESLGSAVGGLIVSFVLIRILSSFLIVFLVGLLNLTSIVFCARKNKAILAMSVIGIFAIITAWYFGALTKGDMAIRQRQWGQWQLVAVKDSLHGNLVLVRKAEGYSLYENGLLSYTTKDTLTSEENIHYALLIHPDPKEVLIIGGGIAGGLQEALKYESIKRIDYIELDPAVVTLSRRYLPKDVLWPLDDKRIHIIYTDGRLFVKRKRRFYDVIIVNLPDPYTALINRYYTQEFFAEAKDVLKPKGLIALSVTSSENYLNKETKDFLRSIHTTLRSVFKKVGFIPGSTHIFLASKDASFSIGPQLFIKRLKERKIHTQYVREYYIPFRMSPDRMAYIKNILSQKGIVNTDMHPVTYLFDMILWSTYFHSTFRKIIESVEGINIWYLMIIPLLIFVGGLIVRWKRGLNQIVTLSILTTGFSEMVFQIIVILAFQSLYGYAYYKIGIIITSFMIGLCLGTLWSRRIIRDGDRPFLYGLYCKIQFAVALYPLFLVLSFWMFRSFQLSIPLYSGAMSSIFAFLPVIAGIMGGVQYPLAVYLQNQKGSSEEEDITAVAGGLYAWDVFGAMAGALLTGAVFVPLLGIPAIAFWCSAINGAVFILLLLGQKG